MATQKFSKGHMYQVELQLHISDDPRMADMLIRDKANSWGTATYMLVNRYSNVMDVKITKAGKISITRYRIDPRDEWVPVEDFDTLLEIVNEFSDFDK